MAQPQYTRRYDIDWLRTIAFLILILYHIGMYYVLDWGWHIKSDNTFRWLQEVMILTNTWRMSLLFFISAIALSLVQQRYSIFTLVKLRSSRLLIPLIFGMFVIVPPQAYVEALGQGLIESGYIDFWREYIDPNTLLLQEHHSPIGLLTWNHLWFLPYLWCYSIIALTLSPLLNRFILAKQLRRVPFWVFALVLVATMVALYLMLRLRFPTTHALTDDWYNHGKYFLVFLAGYFIAQRNDWWGYVVEKRIWFLVVALMGYLFIVADRNGAFEQLAALYDSSIWVRSLYGTLFTIHHWAWIFAALGFAGFYLTTSNRYLRYANKAILPWYIFHQTIIVVLAWAFKLYSLPAWFEFPTILILTLAGCGLGYELVRRNSVSKWLFGIK